MSRIASACPKQMVFGPCGGVTAELGCEVDGRDCPFCASEAPPAWDGPTHQPRTIDLPSVIVDFRPDPTERSELDHAAEAFAGRDIAVLVGEHVDDLTRHEPHVVCAALVAAGLRPIVTITGRGRAAGTVAHEIDAVLAAGPLAVHAVTGDHPAARSERSGPVRFGLDGMRIAAAVRDRGGIVTVAESPAAPPTAWRPSRLADKQRAGADVAILNHTGALALLEEFAAASRAMGVTLAMVAPVPVITDHRSAEALAHFPGLVLPVGLISTILGANDPLVTGIDVAIELGRRALDSPWFDAVNLSGAATGAGVAERADVMAAVVAGILG
jgi:methylenetetrahydrofolate reductase (NADPH)